MAAILKNVKSPYLPSHLTDFNEIWHVYGNWPPTGEVSFYIYDRPLIDRYKCGSWPLCL